MTDEKHQKKDKSHKKRKSLPAEESPAKTANEPELMEVDTTPAVEEAVLETKKDKKKRKSSLGGDTADDGNYDARLSALLPFAKPLAPKKLNKKVMKTVKKAAKSKHIKRGVKEVVKSLRKGDKGLVVIAGDISPGDVISHIPVLCEDNNVPYLFVPSKEDLGSAGATKRPTSCVMVVPGGFKKDKTDGKDTDYKEGFDEIVKEIKTFE
ncbi:50S ribosomal protein L30e-like protein [Lipomyces chichibuensis]|uniref:50S ribosomal protein L30e-like protein n=1 Tax=Lipomyces chichibuensis TaxID=1546026 RepID=UPI003343E649